MMDKNLKIMFYVVILMMCLGLTMSGKVLLVPYHVCENSRHRSTESIAGILANAGHEVTYLAADQYRIVSHENMKDVNLVTYKYPDSVPYILTAGDITDLTDAVIYKEIHNLFGRGGLLDMYATNACPALYGDSQLLEGLKKTNFDLLILDSMTWYCESIMMEYLQKPTILWSNGGFEFHVDSWLAPLPLSFVPLVSTSFSDEMTFTERALNVFYYFGIHHEISSFLDMKYETMEKCKSTLKLTPNKQNAYKDADLLFVQSNMAYVFPRPLMPNVIPILGLKDKPIKPLQDPWKTFIEGATKQDGFILFTLGSMATTMGEHYREIVATVFGGLKQRVIWRYSGPKPETLANNTLTTPSLPQNDFLGHPKIRLFITHCGASGSAEAIYQGVPIIGIPLFYDQRHHCSILTVRHGMGTVLSIQDISIETLSRAINKVLSRPEYKDNALETQTLVKDEPYNASYAIKYWAEYVMRHKGAKHLRSEGLHKLNFFQYFLLDIALVMIVMALGSTLCITFGIRLLLKVFK